MRIVAPKQPRGACSQGYRTNRSLPVWTCCRPSQDQSPLRSTSCPDKKSHIIPRYIVYRPPNHVLLRDCQGGVAVHHGDAVGILIESRTTLRILAVQHGVLQLQICVEHALLVHRIHTLNHIQEQRQYTCLRACKTEKVYISTYTGQLFPRYLLQTRLDSPITKLNQGHVHTAGEAKTPWRNLPARTSSDVYPCTRDCNQHCVYILRFDADDKYSSHYGHNKERFHLQLVLLREAGNQGT